MSDPATEQSASGAPLSRVTTAGRLLRALADSREIDLALLARRLGIPARALHDCRDGIGRLEPETQILLAALALEIAPEHARLARRLHGQAQSALRVREGSVVSHLTNQRRGWR